MKQIKEARNIEIFVNIRYEEKENGLLQKFNFAVTNKKHLDYLFDARYLFKRKIDKLIKEILLEGYISRVDSKDEIDILYQQQKKPLNSIKKIQTYVPPYLGCKFCEKAQDDNGFIYCPEKNKHYSKEGIQRCPVFRSKEEIIT